MHLGPVETEMNHRLVGVAVLVNPSPQQFPLQDARADGHAVVRDDPVVTADLHGGAAVGEDDPLTAKSIGYLAGEPPGIGVFDAGVCGEEQHILRSVPLDQAPCDLGAS